MKKRMFAFITVCVLVLSLCGSGIATYANAPMGYEYLFDKNSDKTPGVWFLSPDLAGKSFKVSFEAQNYFNGIYGFYYCTKFDVPILVTVFDERGNEAWSDVVTFYGDNEKIINFDKVMKPGYYEVLYEIQEIDLDEFYEKVTVDDGPYWIVGSANPDENRTDVSIEHKGGVTGTETLDAPYLALVICEPDPNATEEPTEAPTATPTEVPTETSTEAPTSEQTAGNTSGTSGPMTSPGSNQPAKTPNASQTKADSDNGNTGLIIGIVICAAVIIVSAIAIIIFMRKKKKN